MRLASGVGQHDGQLLGTGADGDGVEGGVERVGEAVVLLLEGEQVGRERRQPAGLNERLAGQTHQPVQAVRRNADHGLVDGWGAFG